MTPIPPHQLCTDCKINKRALAEVFRVMDACAWIASMTALRRPSRKKKPSPKQKGLEPHPYTAEQYERLWERMGGDAKLDNWEEL